MRQVLSVTPYIQFRTESGVEKRFSSVNLLDRTFSVNPL